MTNFARKIGAAAIALGVVASVAPSASAQSATDLQAQIAALMAQLQSLQGTATQTTTSYTFTRDLTVGSTGADVKALQQFLNSNGFTVAASGAGSVGMESTYFGNATKAALIKFQAAKGITPAAGYFGAKTRAFIATMGTGTTTTTPVVTSAPFSVSLASDNAVSANVQRGSANNTVLKIKLTGGATAATITGLTLKSYGTTEATGSADISAVKLYDENGIQLGNNRTPAGNALNFVIVPALTIPANGSKTITVTADIGSAATVMSVARYGIESATGILGGATFTGSYPVIGNSFTIVPAGQLGSLTVGQFGSLPKTSTKVGEKDIVLERFNVSAGSNEDIAVNQVTLTKSGNAADSAVTNLRLRKVGETAVLAGPLNFSNKKATFNLTNAISLTKGSSVNLEVIGDIVDGTASPIAANVAVGGVIARGMTSGTNITSTGSTTANNITIGNETTTVSMASSHPQGADSYIIKTTNKKDLAKFDVRANGGDVIFNTIDVNFNITDVGGANDTLNGTTYLSSVGLYDGDSLISDLKTANVETDLSFALNYTVPANTTKTLTVKGITNTLSFTTSATLATTWSGYTGYGLASGEALTSTADVSTTAVTVYPSGTTTNTADSTKTPYNQAILAPSNGVTMAALKLYAQREDMKLTDVVLTAAGQNANGDISSVTLYAEDGTTQLTNPITNTAATYVIGSSDILNDIVVKKGEYKTILVKANISTTLDGAAGVTFTIANAASQLVFVGQDSGQTYDASAVAGVTFAISSPYNGGTFSSDTKVVTVEKASSSPSGSVARGTQTVTGIWDVINQDSTQAASVITGITFTSKTGLPSALNDADNNAAGDQLFALYDGEGNLLAGGTGDTANTVIVKAAGTVAFTAVGLTINPGETKQLKLVVDTTSTTNFASNTQLQWSIEAVGNVTVTGGAVGYAAGKWSIPAVVNTVTLP